MLRKKSVKIIAILSLSILIIAGSFLYYKKVQNIDGKVELDLQEASIDSPIAEMIEKDVEEEDAVQVQPEKPAIEMDKKEDGKIALEQVNIDDEEKKNIPDVVKEEIQEVKSSTLKITDKLVNWGFQKSSGRKIDTIIIHSSYDAIGDDPYSVSGLIAEYKSYGVAPHYLIDRKGQIYRLVRDYDIAYHAGESKMPDSRTGVNGFSLGIEMMTTKTEKLTQDQYDSLNKLIKSLKGEYKINNILGHNQIAPGRKDDPWNFNWDKVKK
ncbi:MAG: N-acetylmuramoyl-L-alanine amidase [Candidatus Moraniibacteriota bacterium]